MPPPHLHSLRQRDVIQVTSLPHIVVRDSFGCGLAEVNVVAGHRIALAATVEMNSQVIRRQNTVAVHKQDVRRRAGSDAFVTTARKLKTIVRMGREAYGKTDSASKLANQMRRFIPRAIIRNDNLECVPDSALRSD